MYAKVKWYEVPWSLVRLAWWIVYGWADLQVWKLKQWWIRKGV